MYETPNPRTCFTPLVTPNWFIPPKTGYYVEKSFELEFKEMEIKELEEDKKKLLALVQALTNRIKELDDERTKNRK